MSDHERARRVAALRACEQILSGTRPASIGERLATLAVLDEPELMPDVYGEGGPVAALEDQVAGLLGTEAALFFPTGTMAQQVALRFGAERTGRSAVALHPLSHLVAYERDAYAVLAGLHRVTPTTAPRNPTADEVRGLGEPVGTLALELPLRDAAFVLPSWDDLVSVTGAARAAGIRVHLDGARIWESTAHLGHGLAEIAGLADSVYVSFYKSLGGISGAALAGTDELVDYARAWRHRYGGMVFQQWPAALSALAGLRTELPRLPGYVEHARVVGAALAALPGARVYPEPPHTHRFQLWLPYEAGLLNEANLALAEQERAWFVGGWQDMPVPGLSMAEVTVAEPALRLSAAAVTELAGRFLARVPTS
jgi:threonine aldolase